MKSFGSDNYAGVLPQVMQALQQANHEHARSYGGDAITAKTKDLLRDIFGADIDIYFVFNGTGANVLSISSCTQSFNSVLCANISHIYNDESAAPETFTGCRFFPLPVNDNAKLEVPVIEQRLIRKGDIHYAQAGMLSITQATEYGTAYTQSELQEISNLCRRHGIYLHMDGSRLFNAAAGLGCSIKEITTDAGIDILSLGGTKAGMMFGEAVIVFNNKLKEHVAYKHKQVMQLASKTRFISAQFAAMFKDELWRSTALHANKMARLLADTISKYPGIRVTKPVQANEVFAEIPREWNASLMDKYPFYVWVEATNEVRLVCAFDTSEEDIKGFDAAIADLKRQ
ncbi:MAG: low specificity L-threonine aldolase [Bacteroidetes bacterium]|nr:low specificity L-threonine aldolase [Bacteroidota bacterium]